MKNPKGKGSAFERATAQRLSLWASDLKRKDIFWRSSNSGGRSTWHAVHGSGEAVDNQSGDISANDPIGFPFLDHFFVECKHLRDLHLAEAFLYGSARGPREVLWEKPLAQAVALKRELLVIAQQNHRDAIVLSTEVGRDRLRLGATRTKYGVLPILATFPGAGIVVTRFVDLLTDIEYPRLIRALETVVPRQRIPLG